MDITESKQYNITTSMLTTSMLKIEDYSKHNPPHIAHINAQNQDPAPYDIKDRIITTKLATKEITDVISKDIIKNASETKIDHVYYIQNTFNTLQFMHNLLIWAIEILSVQQISHSKNDDNHSAKRSKMSDDCESEHIPLRKRIEFPACNTITAATLILRHIRHEYWLRRNSWLLDNSRMYYFIRQANDTIVKCLKEAGFLARESPECYPPNEILDSIGISRELCILANIHLLYHTPGVFPEMLFKNGIDIRYSKIGSFGRGAYFTTNSYKAMQYFQDKWNVKPDNIHPEHRYLTISLVSLGRIKAYSHLESDTVLFREPNGYDSVMGSPKDANEITVFNQGRMLLSYVVYYKIDKQPALPGPVNGDGCFIPRSLSTFFNQLKIRAKSVEIHPDMCIVISKLIKKEITPTEFVGKISSMLNAPSPNDLIETLEKQLASIKPNMLKAPITAPITATAHQNVLQNVPVAPQTVTGMQNVCKTSIILPSSLKSFFEKIKSKITDKYFIDRAIFDLIGGKINAQTFLDKINKVVNFTIPPELVGQLEEQVKLAKFKYDSSISTSGITQSNTPANS